MHIKYCSKCKKNKGIEFFYKDANAKSGRYSSCKSCKNKSTQNWRKNNSKQYNEYVSSYRKTNRFKVHLKAEYNLTVEQWSKMFQDQKGLCAICEGKGKKLVVDHCHATGTTRGLLCHNCNRGLHYLDTKGWLDKALLYKDKIK